MIPILIVESVEYIQPVIEFAILKGPLIGLRKLLFIKLFYNRKITISYTRMYLASGIW
jgi:hypothetical protein